jgi:hypothetical protein
MGDRNFTVGYTTYSQNQPKKFPTDFRHSSGIAYARTHKNLFSLRVLVSWWLKNLEPPRHQGTKYFKASY